MTCWKGLQVQSFFYLQPLSTVFVASCSISTRVKMTLRPQ